MYTKHLFSTCADAATPIGNALAVMVGFKGAGPAFGGEFGIGLRVIGSGSVAPTHWLFYTLTNEDRVQYVDEFNGPGPYTLMASLGATEGQVTTAKANMIVEIVDTPADLAAHIASFLAAHSFEMMPE